MTESMLVTAQVAYVYPYLGELADRLGDRPFAAELRRRGRGAAPRAAHQWTGSGWYSRGYAGDRQIGSGAIFGEPQPWAILSGAPSRQARDPAGREHPPVPRRRRRTAGGARPVAHRIVAQPGAQRSGRHGALVAARRCRRQQRQLRRRRVVRRERVAHVGAGRARRRRPRRAPLRVERVHAQHAGEPMRRRSPITGLARSRSTTPATPTTRAVPHSAATTCTASTTGRSPSSRRGW